jgi:hypothetical protein
VEPAKSAAPPTSAGAPTDELLRLQASAGNRAVTGLLEVHRDPDPPPTPEPTIADRIAEARAQVTKGEIDGPAFERYRTSNAGTVADVVTLLWQNELYLVDIDPAGTGIDKKADKKLVTDFKAFVQARVAKALTTKLRALKDAGRHLGHEDRGPGRGDHEGIAVVGRRHGRRPPIRGVGRPDADQRPLTGRRVGSVGGAAQLRRGQRRQQA